MSSLFLRCTSTATGTFVVLFVPVAVSTNKADTCVVGVVERDHAEEWLGLFDFVATLFVNGIPLPGQPALFKETLSIKWFDNCR